MRTGKGVIRRLRRGRRRRLDGRAGGGGLHQQTRGIETAVVLDDQLGIGLDHAQFRNLQQIGGEARSELVGAYAFPCREQFAAFFVEHEAGDVEPADIAQASDSSRRLRRQ